AARPRARAPPPALPLLAPARQGLPPARPPPPRPPRRAHPRRHRLHRPRRPRARPRGDRPAAEAARRSRPAGRRLPELRPARAAGVTAMALVRVSGPLKRLAGGRADHQLEGTTVAELLRELERAHQAVGGWILDERGVI